MRDQKTPGGLAAGKTGTRHPSGSNSNQTSARRHILRQTSHHLFFLILRLLFMLFSKAAQLTKNVILIFKTELNILLWWIKKNRIIISADVNGTRDLVSANNNWGGIYTQEKKDGIIVWKKCSPTVSKQQLFKVIKGHFILSLSSLSSFCQHDIIKKKKQYLTYYKLAAVIYIMFL